MNTINYNQKDFNLPEISKMNDLNNYRLKYNYRIYGLKQEDNPPILIEINPRLITVDNTKINSLVKFLVNKGVSTKFANCAGDKAKIYVGLRYDVRKNRELSNKIICTIIHAIENNIDLSKVPGRKLKISD